MDTSMRNERGGGSALLIGLAVAGLLLLAGVSLAPQAHAQVQPVLGNLHKTTADKVLNYPYEAGRTGIAFHATTCGSPSNIVVQTRTADFDLVSYFVDAQTNQVRNRVGSGDSQQAVGRVNYLELVDGRDSLPDGPLTVSVKICDQAPSAHTVTVAVWHDQGEHSDRPASYFVRDTSASQDTGIAIHRSANTCRFTDVRLAAGAPEWLELRTHRANGTADGDGARRLTARMEKDHANDRHVRVRFKDDASMEPGSYAFSIVMERTAASGAGCTAAAAAAHTLSYTLNISLGASWERQESLNSDNVTSHSADALGGPFALAMGPRIHRSSSVCRWTDASLMGGGSLLVLQRHATASSVAIGAPATSFTDVRMQRGASGDQYLSLIYRRNTPVPAGTVTAAVELKPAARCANYAGIPGPLTLSFTATIGAAVANTEPWIIKTGFANSVPTISVFSPASIHTSRRYREIHTGIFIGRRTATCNDYSYNLLNHRALFEVAYYPLNRGYQDAIFPDDSFSRNRSFNFGDNDGGFGLQFSAGAQPEPNTTITLHVALGRFRCGNPAPTTLSYTMTIGPAAPWGTLASNVATVTTLFRPTQLAAAASATDTGIRFNRGVSTSICTNVDVELASGNRTHLELQKYNGTTADGAAAASFGGLTMHAGATGKPVGLQFKAGASVPAGVLTVAVIAKPAGSCDHAEEPVPLTVHYELVVGERQPWQVHDLDSMGRVVLLGGFAVQRSEADSGLRVHRKLSGCGSMDVSLPDDAPDWAMLQQYGPVGPVGARARTQTGVPMTGSGAADDRHVRLMIVPSGTPLPEARLTMGVAVAANASCGTGNDIPAPQMLSGVVVFDTKGVGTEQAIQAGASAAVRAIGLETLDAVLARPDAVAGSWSSELLGLMQANEAELERGEFDLRDLAGEEFALALSNSPTGLPAGLALWGRFAAYDVGHAIEGGARSDNELFSASFGIDYRLGEGMMLGLGYGHHEIDGKYAAANASGTYQLDLDLYQPYVVGSIGPGLLAAFASQGSGDLVMHSLDGIALAPSAADYQGWGLGWSSAVERWDLRLRAGASSGELDVEDETLALDAETGAARLAVAYAPDRDLINHLPFRSELEVAWEDDWGDLASDASWLLGAAFEYSGAGPMHARAAYRRAIAGDGDLSGLEFDFQVDPARGGLGPSFALRPSYGLETGTDLFAQSSRPTSFTAGADRGRRLQAEMAWGLPVSGGVLTPYGDWSMERRDHSRSLGLRLGTGAYGDWNLGWRSADSAADELHLELRIGD